MPMPPDIQAITPGATVHVRWIPVPPDLERVTGLDETETTRLAALLREDDRRRFISSRIGLKSLVAQVSGVPAADIRLDYTCARCGAQHGRPTVAQPAGARGWQVSLSHCGPWVLVAACDGAGIGVDVERVDGTSFTGFDSVALSPAERIQVQRLPPEARARARAELWVRKEALLKATGQGLLADPATIDLAQLESPSVQLRAVPAAKGYVAAVAVLSRHMLNWQLPRVEVSPAAGQAAPRGAATE